MRAYQQVSCYSESLVLTITGQDVELVKVLTILTTVDLSDNKFHGNIPKVIWKAQISQEL